MSTDILKEKIKKESILLEDGRYLIFYEFKSDKSDNLNKKSK